MLTKHDVTSACSQGKSSGHIYHVEIFWFPWLRMQFWSKLNKSPKMGIKRQIFDSLMNLYQFNN